MNAVEFIFALFVVFGSTAVILGWTTLVYRLESKDQKKYNKDNINLIMFGK
tara:strand:- start:1165 stop:1317 length:153 start_codon:yes stop_codon:yes gene_type:complete